jgi:hypothetical protein
MHSRVQKCVATLAFREGTGGERTVVSLSLRRKHGLEAPLLLLLAIGGFLAGRDRPRCCRVVFERRVEADAVRGRLDPLVLGHVVRRVVSVDQLLWGPETQERGG